MEHGAWSMVLTEWVRLLLASARFGGALALMPGLSSPQVPPLARATVAFGAGLTGLAFVPPVPTDNFALLTFVLLRELSIGMLIGFAFSVFLWLVEWSAELVDWQVGFGFSALVDPVLGTKAAIVARAVTLLSGVLFFQLDGHHWLLRLVALSYQWLPVGHAQTLRPALGETWLTLVANGLLCVLPFVLPALGIVLLTDFILGMMGRAAPQLSVLLWGMPVRVILALLVISTSLPALPLLSEKLLSLIAQTCPLLLSTMR